MTARVVSNLDKFTKALMHVQNELDFAQAVALTFTAKDCQAAGNASMTARLDRPVKFTQIAMAIRPATKGSLKATVFAKDIQAEYLRYQETGGERRPKRRAILVPVKGSRNQAGNMPRGYVAGLLGRSDVFSGRVGRAEGLFQRLKNGKLKLLVAYEPDVDYDKRLGMRETVIATAHRQFPRRYAAELDKLFRS
ncbi:hypothetical protein [Mesorhizobium sp. J428]|uniref:hypothetical protein n=1 Tax=Mesorhizobium sp. J428 TaxID=2898440 RepID=UPI0021518BA9|nr:hypothetical protein [Mesorhizobium sp. J428]MCR5859713.1 hypothetical protein [Mesorhizobium sp. J428]